MADMFRENPALVIVYSGVSLVVDCRREDERILKIYEFCKLLQCHWLSSDWPRAIFLCMCGNGRRSSS